MISPRVLVAVTGMLALLAGVVLAETLPPAPVELGEVRRNAQGQLEVIRPAQPDAVAGPASSRERARLAGPDQGVLPASGAGRTIVVGPLEPINSVKEAARVARDGDTIEILPGEYRQQAVLWLQNRLTIRGKGRRPVFIADGDSAEGKALWVVRNAEMLIENVEFRGTRVADGNGAGIRFEKGRLRVSRCAFFDNEMGILTSSHPDAVLEVEDSEFGAAPQHVGVLHHLLYAGAIARLSVRGSRLQQGFRGHLIKSRAQESVIAYNMIVDGAGGRASYELEFPNGGVAWVIGNVIGQSANTDNADLISYGAEGHKWPDNALYLAHNTLVNDTPDGRFLRVWSDRLPAGTEVWAINNLTVGHGAFVPQAPGRYDGNRSVADRTALTDVEHLDFSLPSNSPLRGQAMVPGSVRERSLTPVAEFRLPVGTRSLVPGKPLSPGALQ